MQTIPFIHGSAYYRLTLNKKEATMTISHNDNPPASVEVWSKEVILAAFVALALGVH